MGKEFGGRLDENGIMCRPSMRDEYVRRRAAEIMLPYVKRWGGRGFGGVEDDEILEDLMSVVSDCGGYEMAKRLDETHGWSVDEHLVNLLGASDAPREAVEEMTKKWVRCLGIKLDLSKGSRVMAKNMWSRRGEVGEVVEHMPELAKYGVRFPGMDENSYYNVPAEDVFIPAVAEVANG